MTQAPAALLFTDLVGSTAIASTHGDEVARTLMRRHDQLVCSSLELHRGRRIKRTGDGYLLAFATVGEAVACALDVRRAFAEYNSSHPEEQILVRMGLHAGSVVEEDGDLFGLAVNAAARITGKAAAGQVLVSETVRRAVEGSVAVDFVDRGLYWLKGFAEQWRLFELREPGEVPAPRLDRGLPFVGRQSERAALRRLVDTVGEGTGAVVLVNGVSGVGKTRLAEEIGGEAAAGGMHFLVGRCSEASTGHPYMPLVEIFESLERRLPATVLRRAIGDAAGELARLLPHLRRTYDDVPPPVELAVHQERRYLFASIRDVFGRLAALQPMVLLLDDLHWADESTLLLLEHLVQELAEIPMLVIATYTDEELSSASPLRASLPKLHRSRVVHRVTLAELTERDVEELLAPFGHTAVPPGVLQFVHRETQGNPFFVEELVSYLVAEGRLFDESGRWRADVALDEFEVPEKARVSIGGRLEKLQPGTLAVLTIASLVGRAFGFDLLAAIVDADEDELLDALDDAERARLITSTVEDGVVRFRFAHELLRQTLAGKLSLTRRQRSHLRIADMLEQRAGVSLATVAADIAYHLERAGRWADPERSRRILLVAGDRALEAAAYREALRHFDRALSMSPDRGGEMAPVVIEKMGIAERSLGNLDEAFVLWHEALDGYETQGDRSSVARLCLDAARVILWRNNRAAVEIVERGLSAVGEGDSHRAGLLAVKGAALSQLGRHEEATGLLAEALDLARRCDDHRILGLALYCCAAHHFGYEEDDRTVELGREGLGHLRASGDLWSLADVMGYVATSLGWLGRFTEAAATAAEAELLAHRLGNWAAYVFADAARDFSDLGGSPDPAVLERRGERALELGAQLGFPWLSTIGHTRLGRAKFWRGEWEEALVCFEAAARAEHRIAAGGHAARLFLVHAYLGDREQALALLARSQDQFPRPGRPSSGTQWSLALTAVEALAMIDEREQAAALYPLVRERIAAGGIMRSWDFRLLHTVAGIAATCGKDWEAAEAHFAAARELAASLPMRLERPEVDRFHVRMLLARRAPGDENEARRLAGAAATAYVELGMPRHAALVRSLVPT